MIEWPLHFRTKRYAAPFFANSHRDSKISWPLCLPRSATAPLLCGVGATRYRNTSSPLLKDCSDVAPQRGFAAGRAVGCALHFLGGSCIGIMANILRGNQFTTLRQSSCCDSVWACQCSLFTSHVNIFWVGFLRLGAQIS